MCIHSVRFYDDDYPAEEASDFIAAGLLAGDACFAVLTSPHRQVLERCLEACGIATRSQGTRAGSYSATDTHHALAQVMVDGRLDHQWATEFLVPMLRAPSASGRVRIVSDLAPELFASGNSEDAVAFEGLVDEQAALHAAAVFCAYPVQGFWREGHTESLFRLSAKHSELVFPEGLWIRGYLNAAAAQPFGAGGRGLRACAQAATASAVP